MVNARLSFLRSSRLTIFERALQRLTSPFFGFYESSHENCRSSTNSPDILKIIFLHAPSQQTKQRQPHFFENAREVSLTHSFFHLLKKIFRSFCENPQTTNPSYPRRALASDHPCNGRNNDAVLVLIITTLGGFFSFF